jgi:hypothetical protein
MAERGRLWRRRSRPVGDRSGLTEEAVAVMREEGLLSTVVRLPAGATASSALLPPPAAFPLPAAPAAAVVGRTTTHRGPQELCLADGSRARVTAAGLIVGRRRAPAAGAAASSIPRLEVDDDTRSLSREHARLTVGEDGVVRVEDLATGNGTSLRRPDGTTTALVPGVPIAVRPGDVLRLGGTVVALREASRG